MNDFFVKLLAKLEYLPFFSGIPLADVQLRKTLGLPRVSQQESNLGIPEVNLQYFAHQTQSPMATRC